MGWAPSHGSHPNEGFLPGRVRDKEAVPQGPSPSPPPPVSQLQFREADLSAETSQRAVLRTWFLSMLPRAVRERATPSLPRKLSLASTGKVPENSEPH